RRQNLARDAAANHQLRPAAPQRLVQRRERTAAPPLRGRAERPAIESVVVDEERDYRAVIAVTRRERGVVVQPQVAPQPDDNRWLPPAIRHRFRPIPTRVFVYAPTAGPDLARVTGKCL